MEDISEGSTRLYEFRAKVNERVIHSLDKIIASVESSLRETEKGGTSGLRAALKETVSIAAKHSESITQRQRQYHLYISKLLKLIDKQCQRTGSSSDARLPFFPQAAHLHGLKLADPYIAFIVRHFAWYGYQDAALSVRFSEPFQRTSPIRVADLVLSTAEWHHMRTVSPVAAGIRAGDFSALHSWLYVHHKVIGEGPTRYLSFEMAAARYLQVVESSSVDDAVLYAKENFAQYYDEFSKQIGELMAMLLWKEEGRKDGTQPSSSSSSSSSEHPSPYAGMTASNRCELLCISVLRFSAQMHDMPPFESSLQTLMDVGLSVAETELFRPEEPADLGPFQTVNGMVTDNIDADAEIPVELSVPECYQFHSTFSCPVTWQRATSDNGPVLLSCGHALLESTAKALPRHAGDRIECPTCYNRDSRYKALIKLVI